MFQYSRQRGILGILAITQLVSWGSIYYAFSVLSPDIQRDLRLSPSVVFGAFSWSLLVSGLLAPPVGVLLDRIGGRAVMGAGSLVGALGLAILSQAASATMYLVAWTVLGAAMALVLYEAAFTTINREFENNPRQGISTLTLFAGFASTLFWPLTLKLNGLFGWRDTYLIYAALQLLLCAPLHAMLAVRARPDVVRLAQASHTGKNFTLRESVRHPIFWWLAVAFATNSFVFSALSVHLLPLLNRLGHSMETVVIFAALIGPMQVAARSGERLYAQRSRPQSVGLVTFATLPFALVVLFLLGERQWAAAVFCLVYGMGNGILTIVRGTVPQAIFGRENYGAISGALSGPSLLLKALGPVAVASLLGLTQSVEVVIAVLFASSICSLIAYRSAVKIDQGDVAPGWSATKSR
jgi:MFS family permease